MKQIDLSAFKTIFVAPGDVAYRFINGREVSLWTPVATFIVANLIYFAVPQTSDLYAQMNNMPYSNISEDLVNKKIKTSRTNLARFTVKYDQRASWISGALLFVMAFLFSLALYFVNYRKGLQYADHLAVSFEFMTLATLYLLIVMKWIGVLILTLIAALLLIYAFQRMAYRQRPFRSLANAAILVVLFYGLMTLYRGLVFFITVSTL